jgi:predicted TIM-barrel fold metal-dependent hydrolase
MMSAAEHRDVKADESITLIDAHHHFWDLQSNHYPWLSDEPLPNFFMGKYDAIKRNFLPEDYRREAKNHSVLKTVHIEAEWDRTDQVGETRWLTKLNERQGMPNAIVAHAWFDREDAEEVIAEQASFALVRGIRSKPVTAPNPTAMQRRVRGSMQDPRWLSGLGLLEKYRLTWDMRVPPWHLHDAAEVASAFPNIGMALNHTGFPWDRSEDGLKAWRSGMEALSRRNNVYVKVSEFGLKGQPWDFESNQRVVRDAIAIFGVERCMFGSNTPVSGLRIAFDPLVRAMKRMIGHLSLEDQERFFWRNAKAFYRL